MTLTNDKKFEEELTCCFKIEEFDEVWPKHLKVSKIWTLMVGSFWPKFIMFELKKYWGFIFHDIEKWWEIWEKTDLWFEKWHEEFGEFSPERSKI